MRRPAVVIGALSGALVALATGLVLDSVYLVGQDRQAVVLRLGAPLRMVGLAGRVGLAFKWPLVDQAVLFDRRDQALETEPTQVATAGPTPLVVDAVLNYRIVDPLGFYRALGPPWKSEPRLQAVVAQALRGALNQASAPDILANRRDQVMQTATAALAKTAAASRLGIQVIDLRLSRAEPAPAAADAVYRRMSAVTAQQAAQVRATAEVQKQTLMAEADKEAADIRGAANGQAQQIRGAGDARRAAIFNAAYGKDPDFAAFLRTMQAYRNALGQGDTTFVLTADSPFLRDLKPAAAPKR